MSFGAAVKFCLSHPFTFSGRARRSEFWWFYLFLQIVAFVLAMVFGIVWLVLALPALNRIDPATGTMPEDDAIRFGIMSVVIFGVYALIALCLEVPLLAANSRRLHDADQSAAWLWLYLLGFGIVPVLMGIMEGTRGPNKYGPDPKEGEYPAWQQPAAPTYAAPTYAAPAQTPPTYAVPPAQSPTLAPPPYVPPTSPAPPQATPASGDPTDPFAAPPRQS
jgi:uncharacterized membrane protein YhaH (DUF805 family)